MDYVNLGKTGLKVSRICLGCMTYGSPAKEGEAKGGRHFWALTEDQSRAFFKQALDLGINFFDTANDRFGNTMYSRTQEDDRRVVERLEQTAGKRGVPMSQVALAWLLSKPAVTSPIVGATKPHHLSDAVAALSLKLSTEEITALEEPYAPHPVLGFS